MERAANMELGAWPLQRQQPRVERRAAMFVAFLLLSALASATFATWLPLQFSVVTVFLFAGPHNLLEFRYFLTRLPVRFGRSRNFFLTAFGGILLLTIAYLLLPVMYYSGIWTGNNWVTMLGGWNALVVFWIASLVWLRGKQRKSDWRWVWPVAFAVSGLNWLAPELFSLALVYIHPLIAFWFLDRQLRRSRPELLGAFRKFLWSIPLVLLGIVLLFGRSGALPDDNGLAWRISQHAGADLLPNISSHLLVSMHVFLEMLHYLVWLLVLPLISGAKLLNLKSVPLVRHPRGFPRLIAWAMVFALIAVVLLWVGFAVDYSTTRDIYFAVAIAHVLAEAPFLLRTA
jgi:hypothetical protein